MEGPLKELLCQPNQSPLEQKVLASSGGPQKKRSETERKLLAEAGAATLRMDRSKCLASAIGHCSKAVAWRTNTVIRFNSPNHLPRIQKFQSLFFCGFAWIHYSRIEVFAFLVE